MAIETLDKAIVVKPVAALYDVKAQLYNKRGDFENALESCNKSITLDNKKHIPLRNKGIAYLGKSDFKKAIEQFNKALLIDPTYTLAYKDRGEAYFMLGKNEIAVLDFKKACDYGDTDSCTKYKLNSVTQ